MIWISLNCFDNILSRIRIKLSKQAWSITRYFWNCKPESLKYECLDHKKEWKKLQGIHRKPKSYILFVVLCGPSFDYDANMYIYMKLLQKSETRVALHCGCKRRGEA